MLDEKHVEDLLSSNGAAAILGAAKGLSGIDRIAFLRLAIRKIAFGSWPNEYLDAMVELGDVAVKEAILIGHKDDANVICFNMSANLCDCWGDTFKRERRHFEKGLAYADRALEFRRELAKPLDKVAMAHWARGKHLLSLARFQDAVTAFEENVRCLERAAVEDAPENLVSAKAFLAIARGAFGNATGKAQYLSALAELNELRARDPKKGEDVKVYVDQLEATRSLLGL